MCITRKSTLFHFYRLTTAGFTQTRPLVNRFHRRELEDHYRVVFLDGVTQSIRRGCQLRVGVSASRDGCLRWWIACLIPSASSISRMHVPAFWANTRRARRSSASKRTSGDRLGAGSRGLPGFSACSPQDPSPSATQRARRPWTRQHSWKLFYFSSVSFAIAGLTYFLQCPEIVRDHDSAAHFVAAGKGPAQIRDYFSQYWWAKSASELGWGNPQEEVIAMFEPGVIVIPPPGGQAPVANLVVSEPDVDSVLVRHNAQFCEKVFPAFELSDTVQTSRTGELVRVTNRSNIFVFVVLDSSDVDSLVAALSSLPSVIFAEPKPPAPTLFQCIVPPYANSRHLWCSTLKGNQRTITSFFTC